MVTAVETHYHTIASGHAYSTVLEGVMYAKRYGMKGLAVTDHGPAMPGAPHIWHFGNQSAIGEEVDGIRIFRGAEANIMDYDGGLDITEEFLKKLDWVIASYHVGCCPPSSVEDHTRGYLKVLENPYVDALGHSGNDDYVYDYETVVREVKRLGKVMEINNHSPIGRPGSGERCPVIARLCAQYEGPVVISTDAHFAAKIGQADWAFEMLESVGYPKELILNRDLETFERYLAGRPRMQK